ncbi:MAG: glycosyltransferase family 2 protein [Candidatus Omnitrophota bacterium]
MSSKVSIIIATTGKESYFRQCLDSALQQSHPDKEIIVIDNSCGKLEEYGIRQYAEVKIYSENRNMTYCRSLNKGIEASSGDFILCLNDDAVLEKDFIAEALKGFGRDPRIGMVSGRILRFDKKTLDSTGLFLTFSRTACERGHGKPAAGRFESEGYVFGVSGAAAFYRREMLEALKRNGEYLDEDFGFFYEDLDIAWRGQNRGWKGYYMPAAVAYHLRGGTARPVAGHGKRLARRYLSDELYFDLIKNRYLAMIKNDSLFGFLFSLPFIILYDLVGWGFIILFRPRLIRKFFVWEKRRR